MIGIPRVNRVGGRTVEETLERLERELVRVGSLIEAEIAPPRVKLWRNVSPVDRYITPRFDGRVEDRGGQIQLRGRFRIPWYGHLMALVVAFSVVRTVSDSIEAFGGVGFFLAFAVLAWLSFDLLLAISLYRFSSKEIAAFLDGVFPERV